MCFHECILLSMVLVTGFSVLYLRLFEPMVEYSANVRSRVSADKIRCEMPLAG